MEIQVRDDAPRELREAVIQIAREFGISTSPQRSILCRILRVLPKEYNWSEYPNVWSEVQELILGCEWYHVYDYVEALHEHLWEQDSDAAERFAREINDFFVANGIGWQLVAGLIEVCGPEVFEASLSAAQDATRDKLSHAHQEIHEALRDLSRRPEPDLTGAIQHSLAALEAVSRSIAGDEKATLGAILKRYPDLLPKPLDSAVEKMWGYASETARHGGEGTVLKAAEVELVVGVVGSLVSYMAQGAVG